MKVPGWMWIAGLVGAGYAAYKLSDAFKQGLNTVTAPVSDAIANLFIATDPYLSQPTVQSTLAGAVLFPGGALVPLTNLQVYPQGSLALVKYQGQTYKLSPRNSSGNYPATPV